MREVSITVWCDLCADDEQRVPAGQPIRVAVGHAAPRTLDLCAAHLSALLDPVVTALEAHGAPIDPADFVQHGDGRVECPDCGKKYAGTSALRSHRRRVHGAAPAGTSGDYACPECGALFERPQGLGAHRRTQHPLPNGAKRGQR